MEIAVDFDERAYVVVHSSADSESTFPLLYNIYRGTWTRLHCIRCRIIVERGFVALFFSAEQPQCGCTAAVRATCSMLAFSFSGNL